MNQPLNHSPRLERLVGVCSRHALLVIALGVIAAVAVTHYVIGHFAMTTDTYALISAKLDWRMRETAFNEAFSQDFNDIIVVVDGQTPELSESAAAGLTERLRTQPTLFRTVQRPDAGPFWDHDALLYASLADVRDATAQIVKAQPFLGPLASDPSLRGLCDTLSLTLKGVTNGQATLRDLTTPMRALADALGRRRQGEPSFFSWSALIAGHAADPRELRRLILIEPIPDYTQLQPAQVPIEAIRAAAKALGLDQRHGVRVRLTGSTPLQDEEFATLAQRAELIAALAGAAIVLMLWLAVRSWWLIGAILATTLMGLVAAMGLGLAIFHRFNVISVAFIPLFVGLGIDIGIQFSVRYRAERGNGLAVHAALIETARGMGRSLTLAATAIAVGFLAFGPTAYLGVSQLGIIAGLGMFIALLLNFTVLPALIRIAGPAGASESLTESRLARIDAYVLEHRRPILGIGIASAALSTALLPMVHFDFNPIHLRSARVESVSTLLDLIKDPDQTPNTLEVVRPSLEQADTLAARFRAVPQVRSVRTLSTLIPDAQAEKIAVIADASDLLDSTLNPLSVALAPNDAELVQALRRTAVDLRDAPSSEASLRAQTTRLAGEFEALADGSAADRDGATRLLIPGFDALLVKLRNLLSPTAVTVATLPPELVRQWQLPTGASRVSVLPSGDSNDITVLANFISAGQRIAPDVTGTAISLRASAEAVVDAFSQAGALSFVAITVLLLVTLRRVRDVAITMAPIVLTGLLTMATCVLIGQPLNFANIIALPLLFGIGVAFHIYFVMSWRAGGAHLLTSSLARAVFFSALATATGFGSLWASSHPGTASMGKLLMISLVWTLVSALLFQPALMGDPPVDAAGAAIPPPLDEARG